MSIYKHALFVPAVSLLLLSMSFTFSEYGVAWFWSTTQPIVGIVLFLTFIACTSAILLDWWSSKRKLDTHQ